MKTIGRFAPGLTLFASALTSGQSKQPSAADSVRRRISASWEIHGVRVLEPGRGVTLSTHGAPSEVRMVFGVVLTGHASPSTSCPLPGGAFRIVLNLRSLQCPHDYGSDSGWRLSARWSVTPEDRGETSPRILGSLSTDLEFNPLTTAVPWTCLVRTRATAIDGSMLRGSGTFTAAHYFDGNLFVVFS